MKANTDMKFLMTALAGACIAGVIGASPVLADDSCIKPNELEADKMRFVQTQMMVAALQCRTNADEAGGAGGAMPRIYNSYIKANRNHLLESERHLMSYIQREKRGTFTRYLTEVANRVSLASLDTPDFCDKMTKAGEKALRMDNPLKALQVLPVAYEEPTQICKVQITAQVGP